MSALLHRTSWRPVAQVALRDPDLRRQIADTLRSAGWAVFDSPTGYHLIARIAGAILGEHAWCQPGLVVVDAVSPGCSGTSIARGLRDLGWSTPIVVLIESQAEKAALTTGPDDRLFVVEPQVALRVVSQLAALPRPHHTLPRPHHTSSHDSTDAIHPDAAMATAGRAADAAECPRV
jgi:DNA-binding response OmpR family regulator